MGLNRAGVIEQLLGRPAKTVAALVLAGLAAASVSACVATPAHPTTAPGVASPALASPSPSVSGSPTDEPSSGPTASPYPKATPAPTASLLPTGSPSPKATPAPPGDTINWRHLSSHSLPPVDTSPNEDLAPNGILEGWQHGYVEFVWQPKTYLLIPWTSTNGRAWTAGTSINAGLIWKSELAAFSHANPPDYPLSCSFQPTGWADDGQALLFRGRLNCSLGCGSYWQSSETMLVSTNGAAWTDINETKVFGAGGLGPVSGGGSGFAALGFVDRKQILWTSQDGMVWQRRALPAELTQPKASAADPASIDGALVVPGVHLDSGTPYGSASGYAPAAGAHYCDAQISNAPPPVYTPALYASSDGGASWTAVTLPGAVKATDVSLSLIRLDGHTLIALEWYQLADGASFLSWISSDGSNWKRTSLTTIGNFPWLTPAQAHDGGLFFSTESCPPAGYCSEVLSLYSLSKGGQVVTLDQVGDLPVLQLGLLPDIELAIGPGGILASDGGSNMWLGTRS